MGRLITEITASLEDYLEAIYFLDGANGEVRVTDLAANLDISKPSVNRAINTLKSQGYVEHEHYGSLRLTKEGLTIAKNIANRHIMLKQFLIEVLGVEQELAEKEACAMEHQLSGTTVEKIQMHMEKILKKNKI